MDQLIIAVVVVVAAVVIAALAMRRRSSGPSAGDTKAETPGVTRLRPKVAEFHVRGEHALVLFDVPLPAGDVDQVLRDILVHEGVEVVREKRHDLPISQVTRVVVMAKRDGESVEVGSLKLEEPGELPPPVVPEFHKHATRGGFDPVAQIDAGLPTHAPDLADVKRGESLRPLAEEIRLAANVEAGLRAQGLDPAEMSAGDLVVGVLRLAGYAVRQGAASDVFLATRAGETTFVQTVDHKRGDYPELDEDDIDRFVFAFAGSGAQHGLLATEKYAPFQIYEREKREPRIRFLSRERLQQFVDGIAVG